MSVHDSAAVQGAAQFFGYAPLAEIVPSSPASTDAHSQPIDFYTRAESQFWSATALDFSVDARNWSNLPDVFREFLTAIMQLFYLGDWAVTRQLFPIAMHVPHEDERLVLTTQIMDEGRHEVFLRRFMNEVVGIRGDYNELKRLFERKALAAANMMFEIHLDRAVKALQEHPSLAHWTQAVTTYHLVIEGYLATKGEWLVRQVLSEFQDQLPGFTAGFEGICVDESRHVGYGLLALRRRVQEHPEMARIIGSTLVNLAHTATAVSLGSRKNQASHTVKIGQQLQSIGLTPKAAGLVSALYVKS
jgi:ribonucleotide reductase beta subunit family protein with ferritin-like domain